MNSDPSSSSRSLADCLAGGRDNFLLLRFLAATLVLFGHAWALAYNPHAQVDWLTGITRVFSGTMAVNVFFFLSGLLVTMSYVRRDSLGTFVRARLLRVVPGLVACVAFCTLVLGSLVTTLPLDVYLMHRETRDYLLGNSSLLALRWSLPGVFTTGRGSVVNGSLWTLPGELQMYGWVALLGVLGLLKSRRRFGFAAAALLTWHFVLGKRFPLASFPEYVEFGAFFLLGAFCYLHRERVPVSGYVLLVLLFLCAVVYQQPGYTLMLGATTAYFSLWFAFAPGLSVFARMSDYSYGLYLYGYPMERLVSWLFPGLGALRVFVPSFALALGCAVLSWHFVEKPALRLK